MAGCGDCREGIRLWSYRAWIGAAVLLFSAWGSVAKAGTPVAWDGDTGIWSDEYAWDLGLVPNNNGQTYDVTIGLATDEVLLDMSVTVDTVANAGTLRLLNGFSLTLAQPGGLTNTGVLSVNHSGMSGLFGAFSNSGLAWVESGTLELDSDINNSGTIRLGSSYFNGSDGKLRFLGNSTLSGGGEVYFHPTLLSATYEPSIDVSQHMTLTNAADHQIHGGSGTIQGQGTLVNLGLINADNSLRTLTLDVAEFSNQGDLWAESGNLDVNVSEWTNSGTVRVSDGSDSVFTGSRLTNDSTGVIESLNGAELTLRQSVTNRNSIATNSGGQITFGGSSTVVTNSPDGVIEANNGTIRFEASNGLFQNSGTLSADQGQIEFANGSDMFGGNLVLSNGSSATVTAGTTTLTQVGTTLDATSTLTVMDTGTGTAVLTHDGYLQNSGGTLAAVAGIGGTATFNLNGNVLDNGGTIRADRATFNVTNATFAESGVLSLELQNDGSISFTNVDSTAPQIDVTWTGTGGDLTFNNYWKHGAPTALDLSGWSAEGGTFTISGGSALTGSGLDTLLADTLLTVTGSFSSLSLSDLSQTVAASRIELANGGTLSVPNLTVNGEFNFGGGTFDGNLTVGSSADFTVTQGTNLVTGDLSWDGDLYVGLDGVTAVLNIDGEVPVASGATWWLAGNSTQIGGAGLTTNNGVIAGGAPSASNSTYLDIDLVNSPTGVVRAFQNGTAATNTYFRLSGNITNQGIMEADGAKLYFTGAAVENHGTLQTIHHLDGSKLIFLDGATMTDAGGTTLVDGLFSALEVSGAADVELGDLSFSNRATGFVADALTVVTADTTIDQWCKFTIRDFGRLNGTNTQVDGTLVVRTSGVVDAPVTVNPTGSITADSGTGTLNGNISVLNDGMGGNGAISLITNNVRINGTGVITNSGLIEGGAPSGSTSTFLDNDLVNNADGVVRAFRNGASTNTYFQLSGDITNDGTMEADGANLYFTGAMVQNSGTLRALDGPVASKLMFLNNAEVTNAGGSTQIDGLLSALEVSGASDVELGTLSFTNGAIGSVTGVGSMVTADMTISDGSRFTVTDSAHLGGAHTQVDGRLVVQSSSVVKAPVTVAGELSVQSSAVMEGSVTVGATGQVVADSGTVTFNGPISVLDDGMGGEGRISVVADSVRLNGAGVITNSGVIEGGARSNSTSTYLDNDLVNNADGVVRAFRNGAPTNTYFQLSGNITNAGLMEGDGANLYFTGASTQNSGTLRAVNNAGAGSKLIFLNKATVTDAGGTTQIDGALSALEVSGMANVELGTLSFTNGATGFVADLDSVVTAYTTIDASSTFTVRNSARLRGTGVQVDGNMVVYNATVDAPVTIGATGEVSSTYQSSGYPARFDAPMTIENGGKLSMHKYYSAVTGIGLITNHGLIEGASEHASYPQTYLYSDVFNASNGVIRAGQNGAITNSRLQIYGDITNTGVMEANGGDLWFLSGSRVANSGTLQAVDGDEIRFQTGAIMSDAGGSVLSLSDGGTGYITDAGTRVNAQTSIAYGSMLNLRNTAVLTGIGVQVDGDMEVYNATVDAPVTIGATGEVTSTYGSPSYPARFDAPMTIDNGGTLSMLVSSAAVSGNGLITNHGLIRGAPNSNSAPTYLYNDVVNASDGVIRARQHDNGATNTYLQMYGDITNDGVMEADGARLYFSGTTVQNSGTMRTVGHPDGSRLIFVSSARVTDAGGVVDVDGGRSTLEISGASDVQLGTLSLTNGATGFVTDANSLLTADMTIGDGSVFTARNSARVAGAGVQVDGELVIQSSAVIDSGVTVAPGGQLTADYGAYSASNRVTLNGPVTIQNDGMGGIGTVTMGGSYHSGFNGTGSITNNGLIEGGSTISGYSTYIDNDLVNNVDGVVRAFRNGMTADTYFQLRGDITNAGLMEADGANLYFPGSVMQNSGTLRAVENPAANSKLIFLSGATVIDAGGSTQIDGLASSMEVSGSADVELGSLSFSNGATGYVTGSGTVVTADTTIDAGSTFSVMSSGRLSGVGVQVDGRLVVQSSGVVDAPVAVNPTGRVTANSSTATFNGDLLVTNDGMGGDGRVSVIGNGARINGTGVITNSGLVEGGASSSGNSTYLDNDVVNNADGAIRAFKNGTAATNTQFRLSGDITNAGVMEGNDSDLYLTGASVANSGIIQSLNDGRVTFIGGTTVSDAGGTIHVSETGNMLISGTGTVVDSAGVQVDGELFLQGSGVVEAPVTVGVTGQITANSGTATLNDAVTVLNDGMGNAGTISLVANSARINGAGLITNNGLLEGGAPSSGNATYLDNALVNTADGVIRAFQNGMATGTYFDMPDSITNAGVMEADGGNLRFTTGSNLQNSGTLRAVLNSAGSKLIFTSGATVTDAGGATLVDGSWSALEVSGAANVELGTLSFTDGAAGSISGIGSVVIADTMIAEGSNLSVVSSARLSGLGVQVDGGLIVQSSAVVDAPTTINPTGQLTANSSIATFHADIEVLNDGADGYGRISLLGNSARINGTGIITNEGLIEGGAPSGGNATYLDNRLVNHADGVVRAFSDNWAANTTFQLSGNIVNEGLLEADWATLSLSGIFVDNTNGSLSAVNGGRLLVSNTFISGATGSRTTVDGDNSRLELTNSSLVGFDTLTLTNGGDVTINGTNTTLAILSPFTIGDSSVATVVSNGRLQARGTTVEAGGLLAGQGGMVISDVDVEADGLIEATSGATTIQGHVNNNADGLFHVTNSGTSMIVKGALDNALGGTVRLNSNTTALSGAGLFTNAGLLEAGAFSNNSTVTMSKELYNTGEVLATAINGATNTTFQLTNPDLTNEGLMRASGAHILIPGARVDHSGTFRAEHDSRFTFSNSAQVTNLGGVGEVDGDASELRVYSSSVVGLDSLTLTDGGDVTVNGSSSVLSVVSPFTIGDRSVGSVVSGATLESGGITVASGGLLAGQSGAVIANTTVNGGGLIQATTGTTTIRGNVDNHAGGLIEVTNSGTGLMVDGTLDSAVGGTVRLNSDTTALSGSGLFTNHGLLEAGAFTTGNTVTMSKELYNTGEVLATTINGATGTTFQLTHPDLTNAGLMRADGANMLIPGVHVSNSGTFRAENSSYLTFQSSAVVTNLGGGAEIDGNGSELQVYSSSVVDLDSLTLTDGGDVTVNEATLTVRSPLGIGANSQVWVQNNSTLNADSFTVADGGRLDLRASTGPRVNFNNPSSVEEGGYLYMNHYAELNGPGLTLDGTLEGYMMTANTPITVGPTGVIYARSTSDPSNYNQDVTVASGGLVQFNAPNASISGSGTFYNAGTIEGTLTGNDEVAALHNDLVNQEGGLVRVVPNGPATNTRLDMWGDITNEGTLQADAARLLLRGVSGSSTGLVTAINGGQVEIQEGATFAGPGDMVVDGDGSLLAIWSGAQAGFGSLDLLDRGDVMVSDAGSQLSVTAPFSIGMDSLLTVQGDAVLNSGPVGLEGTNAKLHLRTGGDANVGSLTVSNGGFVELDGGSGGSTLTVGNSLLIEETGSLSAFDGSYINGAEITVNGWFDGRQVEVNAPMLVGATGSLTSRTDAQSTYNQNVQVNAGGSVLLDYTSTRITGTGTFINAGTIEGAAPDDGGSVFMDNNITNQAGGIVRAGSAERALNTTFELAGTVDNSGMVEANGAELKITGNALLNNTGVLRTINGGAFVTDGPVINGASGSMEFASGSGLIVLAGGLNSDGILDIADNTVDIDGTLSCGSSSRLHASTGATLRLDDDFNNGSTQRNEFNLLDLTLDLDASGNALDPLLFEVAGEDLGANLGGLTDNFALGTLLISGDDEFVQLVDLFDNPLDGGVADALYVSTLEITDAESRLILNGLNVYYQNFNGNMSQIDYSLGGAFLPLGGLAIPEPTAVLLLAVGGLLVLGRQGRRRT